MRTFPRRSLLLGALPTGLGLLSASCRPHSTTSPQAAPPAPAAEPPVSSENRAASSDVKSIQKVDEVVPAEQTSQEEKLTQVECGRVIGIVGRNHGHVLLVSAEEVAAAVERVYQIRGTATHGHVLTVSPAEFSLISSQGMLRKQSDFGGGHRHRILIRCQPEQLPPELVSSCEVVVAGEDGHEFVIPESHVQGATSQTYDVQGVAGHTHQLVVSAEDFQRLRGGEPLDLKTTRSLDHFHHVYIRYLGQRTDP